MAVAAIILAAGASRRLGRPKQLVRAGDESLLARTVRVVRAAGVMPIVVVLGAHADAIAAAVDLSGTQVVLNEAWETGIASSICAGVLAVRAMKDVSAVMLLVCDQPRLSATYLRMLLDAGRDQAGIVASAYAETIGIPAIFPRGVFGDLLALKGDEGARRLLRHPPCALRTVEFEGGEVDIDTAADVELL